MPFWISKNTQDIYVSCECSSKNDQQRGILILILTWLVDRMTHSCILLSLFTNHFSHRPLGSWTKWPRWQASRLYRSSTIWSSLTKVILPVTTGKCPIFQQQKQVAHRTWFHGMMSLVIGSLHCCFHNRSAVANGIETFFGYRFAFSACNSSAKTAIQGRRELLIHHYSIAHSIASDQLTHFTANAVSQSSHGHGIHWPYFISYYLEAIGLIRWCSGLLQN